MKTPSEVAKVDPQLEKKLLLFLCDPGITLPLDSIALTQDIISKVSDFLSNYVSLLTSICSSEHSRHSITLL